MRSPLLLVVVVAVLCLLASVPVSGQYVNITQRFGWYLNDNTALGEYENQQFANDLHCNPIQTYPSLPASGSALLGFGAYYLPADSYPFQAGPFTGQYPAARIGVYVIDATGAWTLLAATNNASDVSLPYYPFYEPLAASSSGPLYIPSGASTAYLYPNQQYSLCLSLDGSDYYGGLSVMFTWPEDPGLINYAMLGYNFTDNFPTTYPAASAFNTSSTTWQMWMNVAVPVPANGTTTTPYGWFLQDSSPAIYANLQSANDLHCDPIQTFNGLPASGAQLSSFGVTYYPAASTPFTAGPAVGAYPTARVGVYQVSSTGNFTLLAATFGASDIPLSYAAVYSSALATSSGALYYPGGASSATIYPNTNYSLCFSNDGLDYAGGGAQMYYWPQDSGAVNYAWLSYDFSQPFPTVYPAATAAGVSTTTWQVWMNLAVPNSVLAAQNASTGLVFVTSQFSYCMVTSVDTFGVYLGATSIAATASGLLTVWQLQQGYFFVTGLTGSISVQGGGTYPLSLIPAQFYEYNSNEYMLTGPTSGAGRAIMYGLAVVVGGSTQLSLDYGFISNTTAGFGSYYSIAVQPYSPGGSLLQCSPLASAALNNSQFSYCIVTSFANTNPSVTAFALISSNTSGILTAYQAAGYYYITAMTGAITVAGYGTNPINLFPAAGYDLNDNSFYLASSSLAVASTFGIGINSSVAQFNVYSDSGYGYVDYTGVSVGYYYTMYVQPYTPGGPVLACSPPYTQVATPQCGGAGYDLSAVGATDLTYVVNPAMTITYNPCRPVSTGMCSLIVGDTISLCILNTTDSTYSVGAYYAPGIEPIVTTAISGGIQQYSGNGDACGSSVQTLTAQFVCNPQATAAFISAVTLPTPCSTLIVVQTAATCVSPLAVSTPGYSFTSTTCGGGLYDLSSLDSSDFSFLDSSGTQYYWRPCSSVTNVQCASALPSSWCQLGDIAYSLANVGNQATTVYTRLSNGLLIQTQDGTSCGYGFPRAGNVQLVCNTTATSPWLYNYGEANGGYGEETTNGEGYCHYTAVIHTSAVCNLLPQPSSSTSSPAPSTPSSSSSSSSAASSATRPISSSSSSAASTASAVVTSSPTSAPAPVAPSSSSSSASPFSPASSSSSSSAGIAAIGGGGGGSSGLSGGAIAGIVIGSVAGVVLLCLLLFFLVSFSGKRSTDGMGSVKQTRINAESENSAVGSTLDRSEGVELA